MKTQRPISDWTSIEARLNIHDLQGFIAREIVPLTASLDDTVIDKKKKPHTGGDLSMTVTFIGFSVTFFILMVTIPDNLWGNIVKFGAFFPLFFLWLAGSIYLFRHRIAAQMVERNAWFIARSKALTKIADTLGLNYVASPGGAPLPLQMLTAYDWVPSAFKDTEHILNEHGGMDEALAIAHQSGAMMAAAVVIGPREQVEASNAMAAASIKVEDGFYGERNGAAFSAFEWIEKGNESPDIYHLVIVFKTPRRLYGTTQLRTRRTAWPKPIDAAALKPVRLVAPAFEDRFRLRSSDQVEARTLFDPAVLEKVADLARGEKVRAVAFEDHLVIDVAGRDRFALIDLNTGECSEDSIRASLVNIADMLDLADAVSRAFRLQTAA